jgi:SAM-dependent methyltransferase
MDTGRVPQVLQLETARGPVSLGFVRQGPEIYLVARERSAAWPIEVLRAGAATVRIAGGPLAGTASLVTDRSEQDRILGLFRDQYGPERFARWYERPARVLTVRLSEPMPAAGPADGRYYGWLEAEFDNVADDYDHHITGNRMNRLLRDRSLAHLRTLFRGSRHLLEIGCGSGMETMPLLREGHEILAVDISQRMLDVVRQKAHQEGLDEQIRFLRLRARDLDEVSKGYGTGSFDGVYSTYGALNCEPDLRFLPGALSHLLRSNAAFVAGVYNRWCLFEIIGYSATGQWGRAFGRRSNPVPVGSSRFCIDVYAHSVRDFTDLLGDLFQIVRIEGVPVVLPPSDLTLYSEKYARHFDRLARWDSALGRAWPLNHLGDHFLLTAIHTAG